MTENAGNKDAMSHLRAVLADSGNCTADEPQDPSCPRCQARAFLADEPSMDAVDSEVGVPVNAKAKHVIVAIYTLDHDSAYYRCTCGMGHTALGAACSASPAEHVHAWVAEHIRSAKEAV